MVGASGALPMDPVSEEVFYPSEDKGRVVDGIDLDTCER